MCEPLNLDLTTGQDKKKGYILVMPAIGTDLVRVRLCDVNTKRSQIEQVAYQSRIYTQVSSDTNLFSITIDRYKQVFGAQGRTIAARWIVGHTYFVTVNKSFR